MPSRTTLLLLRGGGFDFGPRRDETKLMFFHLSLKRRDITVPRLPMSSPVSFAVFFLLRLWPAAADALEPAFEKLLRNLNVHDVILSWVQTIPKQGWRRTPWIVVSP